jgi:membrane-associated phospholipid phosphatase/tRNA A-37 threonylcarbamoyl transferase component Bud32
VEGRDTPIDPGTDPAADRAPGAERVSLDEVELGERVVTQLQGIGERREIRVGGLRISGKRRRPSGEKPPLPRELKVSGIIWLVIGITTLGLWVTLFAIPGSAQWWQIRDNAVLTWFVDLRNDTATSISKAVHAMGSAWAIRPLRWVTMLALIFYRQWRHLFAAIIAFVGVDALITWLSNEIGRPRPLVDILGSWSGYSHPSLPTGSLAVTLGVIGFALFAAGRWRNRWLSASGLLVGALVVARVYLGVDHLTDGVVGALFGIAVAVLMFKLFVPEAVFPVNYRRGVTAHLDVSGERGDAIRRAVADQLGFAVVTMEPFGLAGSGGSTPLRMEVKGGPVPVVFAKLYAANHLRADRWYKLGRTLLYGSLEDEVRFTSVRRLVEYEDYMLLTMAKAALPAPLSFGVVEITPEREYLLVTEFLQDAIEIGEAEVTPEVVDQSLQIIRLLWDAGLAHRDVKPSNLMVRDNKVRVIDVAFATLRPTPWRQAVDLANMMLVLALRVDPEEVYAAATRYFAPVDIAEAFAATHGITLPRQLADHIKARRRADGTDLPQVFRALSPPADVIHLQRMSLRRIGLALGVLAVVAVVIQAALANIRSGLL